MKPYKLHLEDLNGIFIRKVQIMSISQKGKETVKRVLYLVI